MSRVAQDLRSTYLGIADLQPPGPAWGPPGAGLCTTHRAPMNDTRLFGRSRPLQPGPTACSDRRVPQTVEKRTMCMFRSPFVPALAALGATALLGACGKNGGAGVP